MEGAEFEISQLDELERIVADATAKPKHLAFSLLKSITNNFSEDYVIGRGGSGLVYLGLLPSGLRIAVKKLRGFEVMSYVDGFQNEVLILMKAAHKNVLRLIGYCCHTEEVLLEYNGKQIVAADEHKLICMEYLPNGTLQEHITGEFQGELDWNKRYQILKGICHGLHHLHHELHVSHRDIKPDSILLDESFVPKISDFGYSVFLDDEEASVSSNHITGTRGYMAPEMIEKGRYSTKSDMFSFGVTILKLLGEPIWINWVETQSVDQVLQMLKRMLVKDGAFSSWRNKYQQVRTCVEIVSDCMHIDPNKRPAPLKIIQLLEETESTNYSVSSGHAPPFWTSGDDESDLSDTIEPEPESTAEFPPTDEELAEIDSHGETSTQDHDKPDTVSKLPAQADLSKLKFLAEITEQFSYKQIVGKDGTFTGSHKAFVYKGDIAHRTIIAVKRLLGVEIPAEKFRREVEQFMSLDHKNIVKIAGYCHDESAKQRPVQFKGKAELQLFDGPEQLLCYEYVHNGSLREYLADQGSREIDWHMRYELIKGICEGLHYLHKGCGGRPIVHLNLSPSNVLLDENNVPQITGFDFSKLIGEKNTKSMVAKLKGPIAYLPPDFFHSTGTDLKYLATVDIYSLGLMILEMTTQEEIKGNHGKLIERIEEKWGEESQIASLYTSLEADMLSQVKLCVTIGLDCVKSTPEKRSTAGNILLWLDTGSKPAPVPRAGPGGVPRPPVRTNITQVDDHVQEKEKRMGFMKRFGWK